MATTPKRARTSKPDLQEWDLVVLMKDAQFSGSTWCAPELGMVVLVDALDHQVTITWRDVDSVDQAAKTLTRKTGDRCFGVKRIGRASRDGVAEQASVAAALELCRSELRDEVAALLREQAGSEELVGKLARIDERLRLEAAQELFALMSKEGALPVDNDSGRASRCRVAAAGTVAKPPATRGDGRGTGSHSDGGGHLRDSRAKRLVEACCTLSKKADGSVAVGLSLQPAAATAAKKQRIRHDDPEELPCSQTHAQSMAPSTAAATLPTTAIAKHKLAAKAPSKQPSPRVGGLSGDDDAECKTLLITAVCRPLCVPGGSVKVRLVLSLATAPPLKKQRIARGAQPFEELMPQAEAAAAAAAKAREDELTAKRKKASEGGARKRKEAAAAAPPPSAHQTDADELSIAQRRKLERQEGAQAQALAAAAAAKAREGPTAKRKEAAEGSARKRKEAPAAAPPPSARQTVADELSIAQRRKLERPKEAPAKASAPSPASAGAKEHFGFNSLKYAQEVGLKVVLDTAQKQRHLLFILPTGGGKSLIYQL
jgi:hypothetical protein